VIFLWTPPHFWALALHRHGDYADAGVPMYPVTHGHEATLKAIVAYTFLLTAAAMLPAVLGYSGVVYGVAALALNLQFIRLTLRLKQSGGTSARAMQLFGYSILYLFALFSALWLDQLINQWGVL
jgi:protoheme IX farnesyltransferase